MLRGAAPLSISRPETTRLVDVPIRVIIPPKMAANESGMRYFDGERPVRSAQLVTWGTSIATIGVLFKKADAAAVGVSSRASVQRWFSLAPSVVATNGWSARVFWTARDRT